MSRRTTFGPNPKQRELIEGLDGIYLVDAGAGTGKTFTLSRRYTNILKSTDANPSDILLITFTNNAAQEMKERVMNQVTEPEVNRLDLQEAPISTFHAFCRRILRQAGFQAPEFLGINERLTRSTTLVENEVTELNSFRDYWRRFTNDHPEYKPFYNIVRDENSLLGLIKSLSAKGIFPTVKGWYQRGEDYLDGNFEGFKKFFEQANQPKPGKNGPRQSELLTGLRRSYRRKTYPDEAPTRKDLRGGKANKQVRFEYARQAFEENRDRLKKFVHDLYFGYIRYSLRRNYLNFSSVLMFAYVLLCEQKEVRKRHQHSYVMVDEFQDTSEIQFKLTLLLSGTDNICVVGDWKQSIYSFQYASVDNIREFKSRLLQYKRELNEKRKRVSYSVDEVRELNLDVNYRSTQTILDFSEHSLLQPTTQNETINKEDVLETIVSLNADKPDTHTTIQGLISSDEPATILQKIQSMVGNREYLLPDDDGSRTPSYEDIAVLSRTREFGLELQRLAKDHNLPVAYEGGVELFKTNPALILLAWLRVLSDPPSLKGWSVILERADYTLAEIETMIPDVEREDELHRHRLESREGSESDSGRRMEPGFDLPREMLDFRDKLERCEGVCEVARRVFDRYNYRDEFTDKIIEVLDETSKNQYRNIGGFVQFIEDNIRSNVTYEVDTSAEAGTATVQTIHAAKGLEYPIVIVADMNERRFPSRSGRTPAIDYFEPLGLRQRKIHHDDDTPYNYDNWRTDVLTKPLTGEKDEERRMLYVALTRAENHLFLSADKDRAGPFFEGLREMISVREIKNPRPKRITSRQTQRSEFEVASPSIRSPSEYSVHDLMDEPVEKFAGPSRGKELGRSVHTYAERYVKDKSPGIDSPGERDKRNVRNFLDDLSGKLLSEVDCSLPLLLPERKVRLKGVIDLLHLTEESVEVIDFKTTIESAAEEEYRKQLSVYYHVVKEYYADVRDTLIKVFYTYPPETRTLSPLSLEDLIALVDEMG